MPNRSLHAPVAAMVGVLVLKLWVAAAEPSSQSPPSAPQPAISVQLSISVPEFNPAQSKGAIRCVFTNRTARAIEIASRYDGKQIALIDPSHRWPLRLWDRTRDRPEPQMVVIEPGQRRVLF